MEVRALKKSDVDVQDIARITYETSKQYLLAENKNQSVILEEITEGIAKDCYDLIFIAELNGRTVGWLALYEMMNFNTGHIWNWHPAVLPCENENICASKLIRAALSHLNESGFHKVTIDFIVTDKNEPYLSKYLDWYSNAGITEKFEEKYYVKNLNEEPFEAYIPDGYSIGYISKAKLDDLYNCWSEIFSFSSDQFIMSLDAEGRRSFFHESWSREKPMIDEASLTLYHKDRLIGFSRFLPIYESSDGHLAPIGILPEYRRKGLGRELLKLSMLKLKKLHYKTISFFVSSSNKDAISFYENLGFTYKSRIIALSGFIGPEFTYT